MTHLHHFPEDLIHTHTDTHVGAHTARGVGSEPDTDTELDR